MSEDGELVFKTATELAQGIKDGKTTSVAVVEAFLKQIEKHNSKINAIVTLDAEGARNKAKEADDALVRGEDWGALHGVPFTAKDTYATKGMRTSFANPLHKNFVPDYDAALVAKMKGAGGILIGKTNMPTFAFDWQTNNFSFGRTNNPWNLDYMVGGSSGGSAAALAAGFTPLCLGSDVGGSLRVPAHCCGVFTLRPTEGSLSDFGHLSEPDQPRRFRNMVMCGPMARSVADLKLALSILWGADERDWTTPPVPLQREESIASLDGLKVAWMPTLGDVRISKDTEQTLSSFIEKLKEAGCVVKQAKPEGIDAKNMQDIWGILMGVDMLASMPWFIRGTPLRHLFKLGFRIRFGSGRLSSGLSRGTNGDWKRVMRVLEARDALIAKANGFFSEYNVWITPVSATTAFKHCRTGKAVLVDGQKIPYSEIFSPFNCTTTLMGHPVLVMPIGISSDGLPIGVQIHARRWSDWRLLEIGELMEKIVGELQQPSIIYKD